MVKELVGLYQFFLLFQLTAFLHGFRVFQSCENDGCGFDQAILELILKVSASAVEACGTAPNSRLIQVVTSDGDPVIDCIVAVIFRPLKGLLPVTFLLDASQEMI